MTYGSPIKWFCLTFTVLAFIVSTPFARHTYAQELSKTNLIHVCALRTTNAGTRSEVPHRVLVIDESKPIEDDQNVESEGVVVSDCVVINEGPGRSRGLVVLVTDGGW